MEPHDDSFKLSEQSFRKVLDREVFPAGAVVFQEGQAAGKAYILLRGENEIVTRNAAGETIVLTKVHKGQFFGELALLMNSTRTASAVARTECEVLYIGRDKLTQKLQEADPFLRYWIQYLSGRVVDLSKRVQKVKS
jgi:CRP/FNR family cyclic AMP-dependent transcriptional regulator